MNSSLWWSEPDWLPEAPDCWPNNTDWMRKNSKLPELKAITLTVPPPTTDIITRFSSYKRMIRVLCWCCRFLHNLRKPPAERVRTASLTLQEIKKMETTLLQRSQARHFSDEIRCLQAKQDLPRKSALLQ